MIWPQIIGTFLNPLGLIDQLSDGIGIAFVLNCVAFLISVLVTIFFIRFLRNDTEDTRKGVAEGFLLNFLNIIVSGIGQNMKAGGDFLPMLVGILIGCLINYYFWKVSKAFAYRPIGKKQEGWSESTVCSCC